VFAGSRRLHPIVSVLGREGERRGGQTVARTMAIIEGTIPPLVVAHDLMIGSTA
jgi:hypothetical protein